MESENSKPYLNNSVPRSTPIKHFQKIINERSNENEALHDMKTHVIQVESIDWFPRENGAKHHTDNFEIVTQQRACVVRRGGVFGLAIICKNRAYDLNRDRLALVVDFGPDPSVPQGTKAIFEMLQRREFCSTNPLEWEALFDRRAGQRVELLVRIPPNIPVGLWRLSIITWYGEKSLGQSSGLSQIHRSGDPFYILFNPFVEADPVFMAHALGREEFLQADVGKIYLGCHHHVQGRPWIFGQSRDTVLPSVVHILDKFVQMKPSHRGDPVKVAREIAKIACATEGQTGIVMHRSDGNYGDGKSPSQWTGSVDILESFMKNEEAVKYGQCWVIAGLMTTMFRALGIPSRCVTNFVSGRDPDSSLSVDKIYNGGESCSSPIWNFHVWNEIWMRRSDLNDSAFNGWQAIDATKGAGLQQRGPCSVEAIRRGDVGIGFDTESFFSDVNAEINVYLPDRLSNWGIIPSESNRSQVGQLIVTKGLGYLSDEADGDNERITHLYKDQDGIKDRRILLTNLQSSAIQPNKPRQKGELYFEMVDLDKGIFGQEYNVCLFLHNQAPEPRYVDISMETWSVFYTGSKAHLIKRGMGEFLMQPNERETLTMSVTFDEYAPRCVEYNHFSNTFIARVRETGQTWTGDDNFVLQTPRLKINTVPDTPKVKSNAKVIITFLNPLPRELTLGSFTLEGPGLLHPTKVNIRPVQAKEKAEVQVEMRGWRSGSTFIVATFNSRELQNIYGAHKINVIS